MNILSGETCGRYCPVFENGPDADPAEKGNLQRDLEYRGACPTDRRTAVVRQQQLDDMIKSPTPIDLKRFGVELSPSELGQPAAESATPIQELNPGNCGIAGLCLVASMAAKAELQANPYRQAR